MKKRKVTTDNAEIQRLTRDYCKQLYANKVNNPEERHKFLEKYHLPRLKRKTEIMNKPITSTEFKTVIKNLPP